VKTFAVDVVELTPRGRGAVSVLAVRGPGALDLVREFVPAEELVPGRPSFVRIRAEGEVVDEGVVFAESEDEVELHLHGAPVVVDRMKAILSSRSRARPPVGSLEEQAWGLLAHAQSESAARMLLDQAQGALRSELEGILAEPGEERAREHLDRLLETERVARWLVDPPWIVIAGPANAGKSTLFNLLVGSERAIVHPEAGTTRDALTERVSLGRYAAVLQDTAGERRLAGQDPRERAEAAGQVLARSLVRSADLVLWLRPPWHSEEPPGGAGILRVLRSRADELAGGPLPDAISCRDAPDRARSKVEEAFHEALWLPREPWEAGAPALFTTEITSTVRSLLTRRITPKRLRDALDPYLGR